MAKIAAQPPEAWKMSADTPASSDAYAKAPLWAKMLRRLAVVMSMTALLSGAAISAPGEEGPMATAPLPPPLPAAPPSTGLEKPQGEPSVVSRRVLPQPRPPSATGMQPARLLKRKNDQHHDGFTPRAAHDQKRPGQHAVGNLERRETHTVPQVASAIIPPPPPSPFLYGYIPGAPPGYGYAPAYPPPWLPGPMLAR